MLKVSKSYLIRLWIFISVSFASGFAIANDAENDPIHHDGYEVHFDSKAHATEREIAYQYYYKQYKQYEDTAPIGKDDIGIDVYDIDEDGEKEILSYLQASGYCGSAGCTFDILKKDKATGEYYRVNMGATNVREYIRILSNKTNGYHDFAFFKFDEPSIWRWNGKEYYLAVPSQEKWRNK